MIEKPHELGEVDIRNPGVPSNDQAVLIILLEAGCDECKHRANISW